MARHEPPQGAWGPSRPPGKGSLQSIQYSGGAPGTTPRLACLAPCWQPRLHPCLTPWQHCAPTPKPRLLQQARRLLLAALLAGAGALCWAADSSQQLRDIEQQFRRGETATALQRLDQTLQQQPGDAGLRFLKAVLLAEGQQGAAAAALLEQLTQDFPELPEPYNNLAVLQGSAGRLDQARSLLDTALRLDPNYRTAHENLGDVYVRLAQRAYLAAGAATSSPRAEPALQNKLRLARELSALR